MEAFDGELIALEMIDLVVDRSAKTLYENYIAEREIPFAAGCVLVDVFDVVRTAFLKRDGGNLKPEADTSWVAEKEPQSTQCDTWARGAVVVKKKRAVKAGKGEEPKQKSNYSFRRQSAATKGKSKKKDKLEDFDDDDEAEDVLIRTVGTPTDPLEIGLKRRNGDDKELTATEIANAKELQEIEDKEAAERERRKRMLDQEKAEIESHEKLVKELKGKDYTFDQNGNVILITPMSKDSLRPLQLNLGVSVTNLLNDDEVSQKKPRKRKGNKKKTGGNQHTMDAGSIGYFTSSVLQPSILSSVSLNPGVDIMEGEKKKTGPRRKPAKQKMSRSDFLSHQSLLESKSAQSSLLVGKATSSLSSTSLAMDTANLGAATLMTSMSMPVASIANATGRRPSQSDSVENSAEQRAQAVRVARANQVRPGDASLLLTKSADWGANVKQNPDDFSPAPVAGKQNAKQKELQTKLMGGEKVKNPRDRPFVSSSPTARRKKLPAPPLGMTTGHGVGVSGHEDGFLLPSIRGADDSYLSFSLKKPKGFTSLKQATRGGKVVRSETAGGL